MQIISANVICILLFRVFEPVKVLSFANILSFLLLLPYQPYNLFVKSLSITGIEALVILLLRYLNGIIIHNMLSVCCWHQHIIYSLNVYLLMEQSLLLHSH
jgi:hypothetical protein